jgi:hypothetical protein
MEKSCMVQVEVALMEKIVDLNRLKGRHDSARSIYKGGYYAASRYVNFRLGMFKTRKMSFHCEDAL